jgi:hypothetical protein
MTQIINPKKPPLQVADILRDHIADYQKVYPLWPEHKKILSDLLNCRTAHLGGKIECCDHCGTLCIVYHSCRNRHRPTCQHMPREQWLEKRKEEILPVGYFHVVFTLPHELNAVILNNKKMMFNILFAAASKTLLTFSENELGGKPGFLAILHTWDQKLHAHFYLHCIVAAGVVSKDCNDGLHVKTIIFLIKMHYHWSSGANSSSAWTKPAKLTRSSSPIIPMKNSKTRCLPKNGWSVCAILSNALKMCLNI